MYHIRVERRRVIIAANVYVPIGQTKLNSCCARAVTETTTTIVYDSIVVAGRRRVMCATS